MAVNIYIYILGQKFRALKDQSNDLVHQQQTVEPVYVICAYTYNIVILKFYVRACMGCNWMHIVVRIVPRDVLKLGALFPP